MRSFPLILSVLFALAAVAARAEDIIVGITSARPFVTVADNGQLIGGFNVDLITMLCQRMGRDCSLEPTTFPHLLTAIEEGTFQVGLGNMLKTAERENKMLFSVPIWRSTSSFIAPAATPPVIPATARLQHRVCVVNKSMQEAFIVKQPGPEDHIVAIATYNELFDRLTSRRCDIALLPTVSGLEFLGRDAGRGYDYSGPPLPDPSLSGNVHIVVTKGRPELLQAIDAAIVDILRDGSLRQLVARYFPFDIL